MLTFPTHLFNPMRIALRPMGATLTAGESLSGVTDTIKTDGGGFWVCSMMGIELLTPDLIRAWRAWEDTLESGVTKVLVPVADVRMAPRVPGSVPSGPVLATTTDPYFPEAVGFPTPWITAVTVGAAALRATQIEINVTLGAPLKGGEVFSIDHGGTVGKRVYRVVRVLSRPTAQRAVVQIRTPLRAAVAAATAVDFAWPAFVGTLMPESEISPEIEFGRRATVDIAFREAF